MVDAADTEDDVLPSGGKQRSGRRREATVRNRYRVPFAPRTFSAAPAMANDALKKRAPQKLPGDRQG